MPGLLGLLDLIAAPSPEQARGLLSDLVAAPRNRLRGLLSDPSGFLQSAISDVVPTDQQAQEQLARYRMPASQDYAMGPSGYDNKMRDIALGALTVYHGSPHKFDKFDMSKIGTGEGAQAYGHGLYFAESPGVAGTYQQTAPYVGRHVQQIGLDALKESGGDVVKASSVLQKMYANNKDQYLRQPIADAINNIAEIAKPTNGNIYKVDLPDESIAKMLDWDKSLSQQAPEVQKALSSIADMTRDSAVKRMLTDPQTSGDDLHKALTWLGDNSSLGADRANAASILRQAGIPGIRYLDGGSRNAGKGTYNYVVFDDALPTILERNGQKLK